MKPLRRSDGARHLARLGLSDADLAARLDVAPPEVNRWKTGARVPGATNRAKLERALGIPAASWDANVTEVKPPPRPGRPGRPADPDVEVIGAALDYEPVFGPSTPTSSPAAPAATRGEPETEEARLVRLPAFTGLVVSVVEALRPWPDAREAVIAALEARR